jgi:hypothetical protein
VAVAPSGAARTPAAGFDRLPPVFEENRGQTDARVAFLVRGRGLSAFLTAEGITWAIRDHGGRFAVKAHFVGASAARPEGRSPAPTTVSHFRGPRAGWATGCRTFGEVVYRDLWPGIDLRIVAGAGGLKSTYEVAPGADPTRIRVRFEGAAPLSVTPAGDLEVRTPRGGFRDGAPEAWQADGEPVEAAWRVEGDVASFRLARHDPGQALFVDPAVLVACGYIGGSALDEAMALCVDLAGAALVAGQANSDETTFPVVAGPDATYNGGGSDGFVAKVAADGSGLSWVGYLGGSGTESCHGIAVDAFGAVYVTGHTSSTETSFPVLVGPDLTNNGGTDVFVVKLTADGTGLVYGGFIGGDLEDVARCIAVDGTGAVYVAGNTYSGASTFPVLSGPELTADGALEGFVTKVAADGTHLVYSGFVGGSGYDSVRGIAVDGTGHAFIAGTTGSDENSFPVSVGPDLLYGGGTWDAFVARIAPDGASFLYSGYIGGSSADDGFDVAIGLDGRALVTGGTSSDESTFPVAVGPDLIHNGGNDAFVAMVKADGTALDFAGYVGGTGTDVGKAVELETSGRAFIAGETDSAVSAGFPAAGGPDGSHNGKIDAFVAGVEAGGAALLFAGTIGGDEDDRGAAIGLDASGNVFVAGSTQSTESTFPVLVGPALAAGGFRDAFVAKVLFADRTVAVVPVKGAIKDSATPGKDSVKLTCSVTPLVGETWSLDPVTDGLRISLGDAGDPFVLDVPPGAPGWKSKGGKHSYKGAGGSLKIDCAKGTLKLSGKAFDFAAVQGNPIRVDLESGPTAGDEERAWTENVKAPGNHKFP